MGRTPCCSKVGLNRGPWTPEEDDLLAHYIQKHGEGGWRTLPRKAGLMRCGKSCRLRWMNYLRPDVKRGRILPDEEDIILRLHRLLGNRWSLIAGRIPGRTDNEIKNFWNTHLSKKLISQGIDPRTHRPLSESELYEHDNNNVDSTNKLSPAACHHHSPPKSPQTDVLADDSNTESAFQPSQDQVSPKNIIKDSEQEIIKDSELPLVSITDSLIHAFNDASNGTSNSIPLPFFHDSQYSSNAVHMNRLLIPYSNAILETGLQDNDASQYFKRPESVTNGYFVAPAMTDSILQSIPCLPGAVGNQNYSSRAFPVNFEQSEMQQRHVLPENNHLVTQTEDYNSDAFSYLLESFMDADQLYGEANKDVSPLLLENRQQFSHTETPNQRAYETWSMMSHPPEYPSSYPEKL